jgi:hypothetical protein
MEKIDSFAVLDAVMIVQSRAHQINTLLTLLRSYFKGISANVELLVYSVICC